MAEVASGLIALEPSGGRGSARRGGSALRVVGPALILAAWWLASAEHWMSEQLVPGPADVASSFWDMLRSGVLWDNLSVSLGRALSGLALGVVVGLALGVAAGMHRVGDALLDPALQMVRTIPVLAVSPLLIVWFGIGDTPKLALIAFATAVPMYVNTHSGVRNADAKLIEAARSFGLSGGRLVREVVLPAALPSILVGLRLALGFSLLALIVAEQVNATRGIGYLMISAQQYFQTDVLLVCIAVYAAWGLVGDLAVRLLERVLMPWSRAQRGSAAATSGRPA